MVKHIYNFKKAGVGDSRVASHDDHDLLCILHLEVSDKSFHDMFSLHNRFYNTHIDGSNYERMEWMDREFLGDHMSNVESPIVTEEHRT